MASRIASYKAKSWCKRAFLLVSTAFLSVLIAGAPVGSQPAWAAETVSTNAAGIVLADAPSGFQNGELARIAAQEGSYSTSAVVFNHRIRFYVPVSGTFTIEHGESTVSSRIAALSKESLFEFITERNVGVLRPSLDSETHLFAVDDHFNPYAGSGNGSPLQPVVALADFVGVGENPNGSLELTAATANALLGFAESGANVSQAIADGMPDQTDFPPSYLLVEDRNATTGALEASVLFTPDADALPAMTGEKAADPVGGNQAFNLVIDPTSDMLVSRLSAHSAYAGKTDEIASIAQKAVQAESLSKTVILADLDTMCAFSTGEKIYTLDIATLSGGKLVAGDTVKLRYLGASGDENAWSGALSNTYEAKVASTSKTLEVGADGTVIFGLYGGGIYALGAPDQVAGISLAAAPAEDPGIVDPPTDPVIDDPTPAVPAAGAAGSSGSGSSGSTGSSGGSASTATVSRTQTSSTGVVSRNPGTNNAGVATTVHPVISGDYDDYDSLYANSSDYGFEDADDDALEGEEESAANPFIGRDGQLDPTAVLALALLGLLVAAGAVYLALRIRRHILADRAEFEQMLQDVKESGDIELVESAEGADSVPNASSHPETLEQRVRRRARKAGLTSPDTVSDTSTLAFALNL